MYLCVLVKIVPLVALFEIVIVPPLILTLSYCFINTFAVVASSVVVPDVTRSPSDPSPRNLPEDAPHSMAVAPEFVLSTWPAVPTAVMPVPPLRSGQFLDGYGS